MKLRRKDKTLLKASLLALLLISCGVYPYIDDCGIMNGTNKLVMGKCYDTNYGTKNDIDIGCGEAKTIDICEDYLDDDTPNFNSSEMCCECGGGYTADGTEECSDFPELFQ